MVQPIRSFAALFLVAVLVLTGGMMAGARGQVQVAGQIVICTGTGPVSISIGTDGQPAGPVHICPDCAPGLFDLAASDGPLAVRPVTASRVEPSPHGTAQIQRSLLAAQARGPPSV